jgi:hypothetical protein
MSQDLHARAKRLIAQDRVEGISSADRSWLDAHLLACEPCATIAAGTNQAVRVLRSVSVALPPSLPARTQMRVQLRASELREQQPAHRYLWLICAVSWALGVATAPYVWHVCEWLGRHTGAPKIIWEAGFALWWAVPAIVAAGIFLLEQARRSGERGWMRENN